MAGSAAVITAAEPGGRLCSMQDCTNGATVLIEHCWYRQHQDMLSAIAHTNWVPEGSRLDCMRVPCMPALLAGVLAYRVQHPPCQGLWPYPCGKDKL